MSNAPSSKEAAPAWSGRTVRRSQRLVLVPTSPTVLCADGVAAD